MNLLPSRDRVKRPDLSQEAPEDNLRLRPIGPNEELSRREFFRMARPTLTALLQDVGAKLESSQTGTVARGEAPFGIVEVDSSRCTGCGLCSVDCPTEALTISRKGKDDSYQILFQHDRCVGCGICQKSCPEQCLSVERGVNLDRTGKAPLVLFEDRVSRCRDCGVPLFPQAMIGRLRSKMSTAGSVHWTLDLCPVCRLKGLLAGGNARIKSNHENHSLRNE